MDRRPSRRELIVATAAAAAAATLGPDATPAVAAANSSSEQQAFTYALQVERAGVIAYRQVLSTSLVRADVRAQLELLRAQEDQHVARLEQILRGLGATIPQGPATIAAVEALLNHHQVDLSLTALRSQHDCLRLLIDVESLTEGAYYKAIPQLTQPALLRAAVEMMGSDAQHWTVLSGLQHGGDVSLSVPYPFVQGSP